MRHPTEGVLRRLLDEPAGVSSADREHVTACPQCLGELAAARHDARLVGGALTTDLDVDVEAGWQRLSVAASAPVPARAAAPAPRRSSGALSGRVSGLLRRPAVAVVAVAVALTGAGTAAANDWLSIFRTERVAAVSIDTDDLLALPDLSGYGELEVTAEPDVQQVPDTAAATAISGLDVPQVRQLPRGVTGQPVIQVGEQAQAQFTFSAERAARTAADSGTALPPVPAGLDGSTVRLLAGPGVAQLWTSSAGAPALLVARAVAPSASSTGVPFEVLRDYLLSLPGLPAELAEQLRTFTADGTTLPLPVPADQVRTRSTDVNGVPATVLTSRDRSLAAVVWVQDGQLTVVAGSLDDDEVLTIARDLQ